MISQCRFFTKPVSGIACVLALGIYSIGHAAAPQAPLPTIESFFQNSSFNSAALSPNARFVAMRVANKNSRVRLAVLDLESFKSTVVANFEDSDIGDFRWVNDERLVFDLRDLKLAPGDQSGAPGLFAVNRDGSQLKQLVERFKRYVKTGNDGRELLEWNTFLLGSLGNRDGNEVFVAQPEAWDKNQVDYVNLQRLNTVKGTLSLIETPVHSLSWLMDEQGDVKFAVTHEDTIQAIHYKDPVLNKWRRLMEFDPVNGSKVSPVYFDGSNSLYVRANQGKDKAGIYTYDLTKNEISANPLISSPLYDIDAHFIRNKTKLLGVRYNIDAEVTQWFDEKMQATQKLIDTLLPSTSNQISVAYRAETPFIVIKAYSDTQPDLFFLFNTETNKLLKLGTANADINPKQMAEKDMFRYQARDGLEIPTYLTLPKNSSKKNLPMVVLVHGGPYVRGGYWNWDGQAQFLASRGYAVLEPEFRGSTGFGEKHFKAGWKQWGLAMQNDIADGTKWAIAQGIADPKRICIAGGSYGGYASLMGLINNPELFRCGIEWIGVTDINLLYSVNWSDASDQMKRYGMPVMIGDQVKDAAQLKATSPLENAGKIKQPLLMAYGSDDQRVPLIHGEKFYAAVKKENPNVEWVVYEKEGHGWSLLKTRVDFWGRVEKFLEKNIGNP